MSSGLPPVLAPMLAGSVGMPADPAGWSFEPKWDGVRVLARLWDGHVSLTSRLGNDVTARYPELAGLARALEPHRVVLDGEVIAFDDAGHPSFDRLQSRMHVNDPPATLRAAVPVLYVAFDVLWRDGQYLTGSTLEERRRHLQRLGVSGPNWYTSPVLDSVPTPAMLAGCREGGIEGYVAKRLGSEYRPGRRSKSWAKIKAVRTAEVVVGGWTEGEGSRAGRIGALAVGVFETVGGGRPGGDRPSLRYLGLVGSGLSEVMLGVLSSRFVELATTEPPFVSGPGLPRGIHWVRPAVVVEVAYSEVTAAGVLRQPSVKAVRDDVDPTTLTSLA